MSLSPMSKRFRNAIARMVEGGQIIPISELCSQCGAKTSFAYGNRVLMDEYWRAVQQILSIGAKEAA